MKRFICLILFIYLFIYECDKAAEQLVGKFVLISIYQYKSNFCGRWTTEAKLPALKMINPLNAELNPICQLLALLGVHHFLYVSRIKVKSLTLRLLMSYIYIYIYIYMEHLFLMFLDHTQRRGTVGRTPLDE